MSDIEKIDLEPLVVEIQRLRLQPGETLLFNCPETWTADQIFVFSEFFRKMAWERIPHDATNTLLFLPHGVEPTIIEGNANGS